MAEYNPSKIIKDGNTYNFRDTTKIPLAGSNEISGSLIPSATDTYNLGSPSYQWNNAYIKSLTINGIACGDILTHNASEFVNVSSNQTIGGNKTFSSSPKVTRIFPYIALNISDCDVTEAPTEAKFASLYFRDKNDKILSYVTSMQRTDGTKRMCLRTHRTDNIDKYYSVNLDSDGNFYPEQNNAVNLGTSTNKWSKVYSDDVVHTTDNETISGVKTFTSSPYIKRSSPYLSLVSMGYVKGVAPSSNMFQGVRFYDDETSSSANHIVGGFESQYSTSGYNAFNINCRNYDQNNVQLNYTLGLYVPNDNTRPIQFAPAVNNIINLGSITYQWNNTYTRNILIDNDINIASSLINKTSTSGVISIRGGLNTQDGASIGLYGKDYNGGIAGNIYMTAYGNSDYTNFRIYPNGTMSVYNNSTNTTKNIAMQENVVPRSGGAVMTDYFLGRSVDTGSLMINGGTSWSSGGSLETFGSSHSSYAGWVRLQPALSDANFKPMNLEPSGTWSWSGTACQITSDQRFKQQISEIDDKLLDAWGDVELSQFKYNDAVNEKGTNARLHTGYVVQQIDDACKEHGVDISAYGLYCHEEYPQEVEEVEIEQADGTKTKETKVIREASEHYSLRYTEALVVECKYLRRCIARLTARIEELEKGNNIK